MKLLIAIAFLAAAQMAHGQAVRFDSAAQTTNNNCQPSATCPILAVPGTVVQLCSAYPSCTTPGISYTDKTAVTACPASAPVTLPGTFTCQRTVGPQGQFGFWVSAGSVLGYKLTYPTGRTFGPFPFTAGGEGGGVIYTGAGVINVAGTVISAPTAVAGPASSTTNDCAVFADTTGKLIKDVACPGGGTVNSVSVFTANGISGSVANPTTDPTITLSLGAITPTSTNGVTAITMGYLDATSSIQTQLNSKASATTPVTGGTCTNQVVTALTVLAVPTCTTITSAYVNNSIALTGTDINTSNQVTVTHLAVPLTAGQGGTGISSLGTGVATALGVAVSGTGAICLASGSACGAGTITLSGDATGSGTTSIPVSVVRLNGTSLASLSTGILKNTTATGVPSIAIAADFPTLNQSTSGNAATSTALATTPTLCATGQAPTGVLASGNATGCASIATSTITNNLSLFDPSISPACVGNLVADDTACIVAALATGKDIQVPDKTAGFKITSALSLNSNQTIFGNGPLSIIKRFGTNYSAIQATSGKSNVHVRNFALQGDAAATDNVGIGINLITCTDCSVEQMTVTGQYAESILASTSPRVLFQLNTVSAGYKHCYAATGGSDDMNILNNRCLNMLPGGVAGAGNGFVIGYIGANSANAHVIGNYTDTPNNYCYQMQTLTKATVSENRCYNAVALLATDTVDISEFSNNSGYNLTTNASFDSAIYINNTTNSIFRGNHLDTVTGPTFGNGIRVIAGSTGNTIANNTVVGCVRDGYYINANATKVYGNQARGCSLYGIELYGSLNADVGGNFLLDNILGGMLINNASTGSVYANDISNVAAAGSNPPGINIDASANSVRLNNNIIHDLGSGTRIVNNSTTTPVQNQIKYVQDDGPRLPQVVTSLPATCDAGTLIELLSGGVYTMESCNVGGGGWTAIGTGGSGCSTAGSATQVLTDNGAGGCTSNAAALYASGTLTLGTAGSVVGAIAYKNATSGTVTVQPVTGALGTVTLSLPAATDTLVGKATTDTFTNKTYDTAGTGNSLKINGTSVTAVSGTGAVCLASGSACASGGGSPDGSVYLSCDATGATDAGACWRTATATVPSGGVLISQAGATYKFSTQVADPVDSIPEVVKFPTPITVKMNGATINVDSSLTTGTTFMVHDGDENAVNNCVSGAVYCKTFNSAHRGDSSLTLATATNANSFTAGHIIFLMNNGASDLGGQSLNKVDTATAAISSLTYTSGGTHTGTGTCLLTFAAGSGGPQVAATANVVITGGAVGAITVNNSINGSYASAPTTATWSIIAGATCSGTATVVTTLTGTIYLRNPLAKDFTTTPRVGDAQTYYAKGFHFIGPGTINAGKIQVVLEDDIEDFLWDNVDVYSTTMITAANTPFQMNHNLHTVFKNSEIATNSSSPAAETQAASVDITFQNNHLYSLPNADGTYVASECMVGGEGDEALRFINNQCGVSSDINTYTQGIDITQTYDTVITGNTFYCGFSPSSCIVMDNGGSFASVNATISNNTIISNAAFAIQCAGSLASGVGTNVSGPVTITGNAITAAGGAGQGIHALTACTITGNTINVLNGGNDAVILEGTGAMNSVVADNIIIGTSSNVGIEIVDPGSQQATDPLIANNQVTGFTFPIYFTQTSSVSSGSHNALVGVCNNSNISNTGVGCGEIIQFCGTTTSCSATRQTSPKTVYGSAALVTGTPSTAAITGISPAFTSSTSFVCTVAGRAGATSGLYSVANVSGSAFTITGPAATTTVINYICVGI